VFSLRGYQELNMQALETPSAVGRRRTRIVLRPGRLILLATIGVVSLCCGATAFAQPYELIRVIDSPKGAMGDDFGNAMVFVGDKIAIAAYQEDTGATNAGSVYIFDRMGNHLTTIHNPAPTEEGSFGHSLAAVGDRLIIGNWTPTQQSDVYLFEPPQQNLWVDSGSGRFPSWW